MLCAGLLASRHSVGIDTDISDCLQQLDKWAKHARVLAHISQPDHSAFLRLVHFFYRDLAFTGAHNSGDACKQSLLHEVLVYRSGTPVTLAVLFSHLGQCLGFNVRCVNFPGHFLLRCDIACQEDKVLSDTLTLPPEISCSEKTDHDTQVHSVLIDPIDGRVLDNDTLRQMYFNVIEEIDNESMPKEALEPASNDEVVVHMLHQVKFSLINAKRYEHALRSIDLLIHLCPNNPYERRDRGVLLHELQCPQLAVIDYQYFIRQCPQDPAATLLAHQVKHMDITPPVMH
nr:tetratricopeptide repeat protein [Paraglaciecola sp. 20A4]